MGDIIPSPGEVFYDAEGNKSTVLPDGCDPNYNPPEDELEEYAEFIGIDPTKEKELLWIALEGLRTPLPPEWRACQTGDDSVYYFNFRTGESLWDHPMDEVFKKKVLQEREKIVSSRSQTSSGMTPRHIGEGKDKNDGVPSPFGAGRVQSVSTAKREGITKAITASLLGTGSTSFGSSGGATAAVPGKTGRLCSLETSGLQDGGSSVRNIPDVSGLLQNSSLLPSAKGIGSEAFGNSMSLLSHPYPSSSLSFHQAALPSKGLDGSSFFQSPMEFEKSIRQRLRNELETKMKAEMAERERQFWMEKNNLDSAYKKSQETLESEWKKEKEQLEHNMIASTSREKAEIHQNWERRIRALKETLKEQEKALVEEKNISQKNNMSSITLENLRKELKKHKDEKVNERRQQLMNQTVEEPLKKEKEKQDKNLDNLLQRSNSFLDETKKKRETEKLQLLAEVESNGSKDVQKKLKELNSFKEELLELQEKWELLAKETLPTHGEKTTSLLQEKIGKKADENVSEEEKEAKQKADEEVKELDVELDAEMNELEEAHKVKQRRLAQQLEELRKTTDTMRRKMLELGAKKEGEMGLTSENKLNEVKEIPTISASAEQIIQRLQDEIKVEEKKAREEMEKRLEEFRTRTNELLQNKQQEESSKEAQRERSLEHGEGTARKTNSNGEEKEYSSEDRLSTPIIQKLKQQHLQSLKQLEVLHEQRMSELRETHHRLLRSSNIFDIRKTPAFTKLLNEKKKAWLAAHPTPPYHVDDLPRRAQLEEEEWKALTPINSADVQRAVEKAVLQDPSIQQRDASLLGAQISPDDHTGVQQPGRMQISSDPETELSRCPESSRGVDHVTEGGWKDVVDKISRAQLDLNEEEALGRAIVHERVEKIYTEHLTHLRSRLAWLQEKLRSLPEVLPSRSASQPSTRHRDRQGRTDKEEGLPTPNAMEMRQNNSSNTTHGSKHNSVVFSSSFISSAEAEQQINELKNSHEKLLSSYRQTLKMQREQLRRMLGESTQFSSSALEEPSKMGCGSIFTASEFLTSQSKPVLANPCPPQLNPPMVLSIATSSPQVGPQKNISKNKKSSPAYPFPPWSRQKGLHWDPSSLPLSSPNPMEVAMAPLPAALHGGPFSPPAHHFFHCLFAARERVHEEKRALRGHQQYLEMLREQWRSEMNIAKQKEDKDAIHSLRLSRLELENFARRLNTAVLALKLQREQLNDLCRSLLHGGDGGSYDEGSGLIHNEILPPVVFPLYDEKGSPIYEKGYWRRQHPPSLTTIPFEQHVSPPLHPFKENYRDEHRNSKKKRTNPVRQRSVERRKSGKPMTPRHRSEGIRENTPASLSFSREDAKNNTADTEALSRHYFLAAGQPNYCYSEERKDSKKAEKKRKNVDPNRHRYLNNQIEQWLQQQSG